MSEVEAGRDARIEEVWTGLSQNPRTLNPKWFYDARGSDLFDAITRQPEYYLTLCEREILRDQGADIARWIGPGAVLAELGAGNGEKAVLLLRQLAQPKAYVPIDISPASLKTAVDGIHRDLPKVRVEPLVRDFADGVEWPSDLRQGTHCLVFFGSTIGNMEPETAASWLSRLRASLKAGDKMLLGVDLKKDAALLNAAYNDAAGITASFNKNALTHLNQALGANFDPELFAHRAHYNTERGRVEMHLEAKRPQNIRLGHHDLRMESGERIHTESSYKYAVDEFQALTREAGFDTDRVWLDRREWFSLHGLIVPS